jgi:hypothetical protein
VHLWHRLGYFEEEIQALLLLAGRRMIAAQTASTQVT